MSVAMGYVIPPHTGMYARVATLDLREGQSRALGNPHGSKHMFSREAAGSSYAKVDTVGLGAMLFVFDR